MITITVHSHSGENLYKLLINKEYELRTNKRGTFTRKPGSSRKSRDKWVHKRYSGWIWFRAGLNGALSATVQTKNDANAWQIFSAFIGFLQKYFSSQIASINVTFD